MHTMRTITPIQICKLNEEGAAINLIDVRTPDEFQEIHAIGAINIPLNQFNMERVAAMGILVDDPVYLICRSGARSAKACEILCAHGYRHVYNVTGGTMAWVELGLPTFRGQKRGSS